MILAPLLACAAFWAFLIGWIVYASTGVWFNGASVTGAVLVAALILHTILTAPKETQQ